MLATWRKRVKQLKQQTYALYLAYQDPRTPLHAKIMVALVIGYAFSPIDLIPDFIPILGVLDDLILLPLGIAFALRLIPEEVMDAAHQCAEQEINWGTPTSGSAAGVIIGLWIALGLTFVYFVASNAA